MAKRYAKEDVAAEKPVVFESTVRAPVLNAARQAAAAQLPVPWDYRQGLLPAEVRLLLKETHEALHDCGWRTSMYHRRPDGGLDYAYRYLDRDDSELLKLDQWGTIQYHPVEQGLDRSHSLSVRVTKAGGVLWWHSATPKGQCYGRHEKLGNGRTAGSLRLHFKGVAPKGEMHVGRAE